MQRYRYGIKGNSALGIAAAALLAGPFGAGPAAAWPPDVAEAPVAGIELVQGRLEMRSYEPYSGLQLDFRPEPPSPQRGVRKTRPEIVAPTRLAPLIRSRAPAHGTAQWYRYCAQTYRSFEPGTGLYTTYSGARRVCR